MATFRITAELGRETPLGGYGLRADPHSHDLSRSKDSTTTGDVGQDPGSGGVNSETQVPYLHDHGALFGAASIPKVRPVKLCQKL